MLLGAPVFTGRDRELSALRHAVKDGPAVVLIEGEAGIGKSRLIQEFLGEYPGRALVAYCPPFRHPVTLGPLAAALQRATPGVRDLGLSPLAGALTALFPEWSADLPPRPQPPGDPADAQYQVFRALAELMDRLAVSMLVVEDAHWVDEATLGFLLMQATMLPPARSLIVTFRPEDVPADSLLPRLSRRAAGSAGARISLGPLTRAATGSLVSSMLNGEQVSREFTTFLHQQTEGLPLAVEELVRLLNDRMDLAWHDGGWVRLDIADIEVPPTVRDAVLERARRLSGDALAMLRAAAVLGEPADEQLLRAVADLEDAQARAGLSAALGSGLLTEYELRVSFRHMLAARAIYEAISGPDRRLMHLRAGHALRDRARAAPATLARHFRAAGETSQWCRHAEQAADLALAAGDEASATTHIIDVLSSAGLPPATITRLVKKLTFATFTGRGRFGQVEHALRSVLRDGRLTAGEEAQVRVQLGRVLLQMEDWNAGGAELERAIPHLADDPMTALRAMLLLAYPRGTVRSRAVHLGWLRKAAAVQPPLTEVERLGVASNMATILLILGEEQGWAEAARIPDDPPTAQSRGQIARTHLNVGDAAMRWGRYEEASRRLTRALELTGSYQLAHVGHVALSTRIHLDWLTGRWDGLAERASALADDEDLLPMMRLEAALVRGQLLAADGAIARAEQILNEVAEQAEQVGELELMMMAAAALARLRLGTDHQAALRITRPAVGALTGSGLWMFATDLAPVHIAALVAAGQIADASRLAEAFARGLRNRDAPAPKAALIACRAELSRGQGQYRRAAAAFGRAAQAWQVLPRPYDALLAGEQQAMCLLAAETRAADHSGTGDRAAASQLLTGVLSGLARLGASGDAARVARTLREHGTDTRRVWRGGTRGYGDSLSPRELEVVRLAITGQTNREIGQALSRSHRTVAMQLSSAMRKLGVSSRTALAAAFYRQSPANLRSSAR